MHSDLACREQARQIGVDSGQPVLGVTDYAADDGAEGGEGGERLPGVLCLGEVIDVVRDDERIAQVTGERLRTIGAPHESQVTASSSPKA